MASFTIYAFCVDYELEIRKDWIQEKVQHKRKQLQQQNTLKDVRLAKDKKLAHEKVMRKSLKKQFFDQKRSL